MIEIGLSKSPMSVSFTSTSDRASAPLVPSLAPAVVVSRPVVVVRSWMGRSEDSSGSSLPQAAPAPISSAAVTRGATRVSAVIAVIAGPSE
jgi:hypothetical protein